MLIESLQNPGIKQLLKLQQKSRERKSSGLFVVEGVQENRLALNAGFEPQKLYLANGIYQSDLRLPQTEKIKLSAALFEQIAYRGTSGGIIGIYKSKTLRLNEIRLPKNPMIVILEAVEKPGNMGAVLRSCDGAGVDLLVVCDPLTDFYNPNVIRSSVGTVFTCKTLAETKENIVDWLKKNDVQIVSTFLSEDTLNLYEADFTKSSAIVLGTESTGLSDFWNAHSDVKIKIPMKGRVDSLNVSNAAAVCVYEAIRQRLFR
jgi:TrmH family RNA methyltransferase